MRVEEKLLEVFRCDRRDVLDRLELAPASLHHHAVRFRIGVRESLTPLVAAGQQRLALFIDLRRFRRSRFRFAEARSGGDGDDIRLFIECQDEHAPYRRLAGNEKRRDGHGQNAFQTSSRIAAMGSRRDAARAGYQVASTESAMATRFT